MKNLMTETFPERQKNLTKSKTSSCRIAVGFFGVVILTLKITPFDTITVPLMDLNNY